MSLTTSKRTEGGREGMDGVAVGIQSVGVCQRRRLAATEQRLQQA